MGWSRWQPLESHTTPLTCQALSNCVNTADNPGFRETVALVFTSNTYFLFPSPAALDYSGTGPGVFVFPLTSWPFLSGHLRALPVMAALPGGYPLFLFANPPPSSAQTLSSGLRALPLGRHRVQGVGAPHRLLSWMPSSVSSHHSPETPASDALPSLTPAPACQQPQHPPPPNCLIWSPLHFSPPGLGILSPCPHLPRCPLRST